MSVARVGRTLFLAVVASGVPAIAQESSDQRLAEVREARRKALSAEVANSSSAAPLSNLIVCLVLLIVKQSRKSSHGAHFGK